MEENKEDKLPQYDLEELIANTPPELLKPVWDDVIQIIPVGKEIWPEYNA